MSGTKATGYSDRVIPAMVERAAAHGALIVLDIKGKDLLACLPFRPAVVKPNLSEFLGTFPAPAGSGEGEALREHVRAAAASLKERYGTELVITRGGKPIWFNEGGAAAEEPIVPAKAINPTGSGDSFTAGLAFAWRTRHPARGDRGRRADGRPQRGKPQARLDPLKTRAPGD